MDINNEYFQQLVSILPVNFYWIDREGKYLGCNSRQAKMFGFDSSDDIIGKKNDQLPFKNIVGEQQAIKIDATNEEVMQSGTPKEVYEYCTTSTGEQLFFMSYKMPLKDKEDKVIGLLGASIDVTERVKMEELRLQKEKSEIENNLKTNFLANMSHDMRSPLNVIYGYAQLLRMGTLSDDKKEKSYQLIEQSCVSLLHLINDIIDISKIESDQLTIVNSSIDLTQLLKELYAEYEDQSNNIELVLDLPSKECFLIKTDGERLKQIFNNLLTNAHKATVEGKITFGYELCCDNLRFFVQDTGKGISENDKHFIFNRFTKLDRTSSGTGLGLPIAQKIVSLLGGELIFKSEVDKGTLFEFSITYVNTEVYQPRKKKLDKNKWVDWTNKVILVVEDIDKNFEVLKELISETKVEVLWAKDGATAIELFENTEKIDLILLDIGLPDIDGYEVLKRIRNISSNIPVIAQTAYAMMEDREKFIQLGFDDFVTKPIDAEQLINTVGKHILNTVPDYTS